MDKRIFLYTLLFLLFSCSLLFPEAEDDIDSLIDLAIKYERENKLEQAIDIYRQVIIKDPDNIMIKVRLAKVLSWKNKFEEALQILNDVLASDPDQEEVLLRKAQILGWQGKYSESISMYELYLKRKKNDADAIMGIARVYFWSGQNEKAVIYFNNAIKEGADEIEARLNLGKVYLAWGDKEKAKEEFSRVLDLDPKNSEAERFMKGIRTLKTYEIAPVNLRWNIYPDESVRVTYNSEFIYHRKNRWDFIFGYEYTHISSPPDHTFSFTSVFKGLQNLYLRGGIKLSPHPYFSPYLSTDLGINYAFVKLFTLGLTIKSDIYENETLFTITPELTKDFSDITYFGIKYSQYVYTTDYTTGRVELLLNLEYITGNDLFIKFLYGGDVEVRDRSRRVFDFTVGISYNLTDNFEIKLSYGTIETLFGKSHEISWHSFIKWE